MPEDDEIQFLLDKVPAGKSSGKYLDQLSAASREVLELFEVWLVKLDRKAPSTAQAYKGYVAKAMVEITADPEWEMDTDVKSAINALHRFRQLGTEKVIELLAQLEAKVNGDVIELDENVDEREDDVPQSGDTE